MTYDLTLERLIDAPPEVVFDTIVDPEAQPEIFVDQVPGWELWEWEIDLRVGGAWKFVFGATDRTGDPDRSSSVFTEVNRPHRLSYRSSMFVGEWAGRSSSRRRSRSTIAMGRPSSRSICPTWSRKRSATGSWTGARGLDAIERAATARVARRASSGP